MATTSGAAFTRPPHARQTRIRDADDESKGSWTSLLESVSSGKKQLAEKTLLILGGTIQSQNEFLEALAHTPTAAPQRRNPRDRVQKKKPPIANRYALGYTYQDVIGADQDDILARLSIYMLGDTSPAFAPLLNPLFTSKTIQDMAVVFLLDWADPWNWMQQLQDRIRVLRSVLEDVDDSCRAAMKENMEAWQERRRGPTAEDPAKSTLDAKVAYALGPGEWDEALGVPLCVVCHNAEKVDLLATGHGWKDREFDAVMQYLRTILLKHGGSLIYTSSSDAGSLQDLVRSSLNIHSLLQKIVLKRNVTDRDKVLIPPNWDSWANIRAQDERFLVEEVSKAWSLDLGETSPRDTKKDDGFETGRTIAMYEETIKNPRPRDLPGARNDGKIKAPLLECPDYQEFLAKQAARLETFREQDEANKKARAEARAARRAQSSYARTTETIDLTEHLGPVQFNMGGISVDVEAALDALQARTRTARREVERAAEPESPDGRTDEKTLALFAAMKVEGRR